MNPTSGDFNPSDLVVANNLLFFSADDGSGIGRELWKYLDPTLSMNNFEVNELKIFPNPVKNKFKIQSNKMIKKVLIYNTQGKMIKSLSGNLELYEIVDLETGIYIINIFTEFEKIVKKIIKK